MNKRVFVPIATGLVFATVFAAGCASHKRTQPASIAPVTISTSATQTAATTIPTITRVVTVYKEAPTEVTTTTTEATTTTTAKPTATPKPTAKPTAKPTKKPTAKPTKKPTKKPTAKPTVKSTVKATEATKANTLKTVSNSNTTDTSKQLSGIYHGSWSDITVDATDLQRVKITATIHDSEDSSKASVWKMSGKYNPNTGAILYTNCTKTNYEYDSNNCISAKETAYNNGQGKISFSNGMITWHDYQEHAADDMTFISAKSHDHG